MSLWVKNTFAGTIETYYKPVPPTNLAGELVVPCAEQERDLLRRDA